MTCLISVVVQRAWRVGFVDTLQEENNGNRHVQGDLKGTFRYVSLSRLKKNPVTIGIVGAGTYNQRSGSAPIRHTHKRYTCWWRPLRVMPRYPAPLPCYGP